MAPFRPGEQKPKSRSSRQIAIGLVFTIVVGGFSHFGVRYFIFNQQTPFTSGPVPQSARLTQTTWQNPPSTNGRWRQLGPLEIRLPIHAVVPQEPCCHGIVGIGFSISYNDDPLMWDDADFMKKAGAVDPTDPLPPGLQTIRFIAEADDLPLSDIYFSDWDRFFAFVGVRMAHDQYYSTRFDRRLIIECNGRYAHAELWDKTNLGDSIAWMTVWDSNGEAHGINVKAANPALRDAIYESIVCSFELAN
jgi:hypothetical protein